MKIALIERELEFTSSLFIQIQISCALPQIWHQKDISCLYVLKVLWKQWTFENNYCALTSQN